MLAWIPVIALLLKCLGKMYVFTYHRYKPDYNKRKQSRKKVVLVTHFMSIKDTMNVTKTATTLVKSIKYLYTRFPSKYIQ